MEKDNKYYSLIEKLVKNHRKYSGYEAILEEIVDDVYKHSVSVISTINDEEVIQSYLQKVVSTSIITVPKRLNYNNTVKHRMITVDAPILKSEESVLSSKEELLQESVDDIKGIKHIASEVDSSVYTESQDKLEEETISSELDGMSAVDMVEETRANKELVDKMINSIETESVVGIVDENSVEPVKKEYNEDENDFVTDDLLAQDENINHAETSSVDNLDLLEVEDGDSLEVLEDAKEFGCEEQSIDAEEEKNTDEYSYEETVFIDNTEKNEFNLSEVKPADEMGAEDIEIESLSYENLKEEETELIENINPDEEEQESIVDIEKQMDSDNEEVYELGLGNAEGQLVEDDDSELFAANSDNDESVLSEDSIVPIESVEEIDLVDSGLQGDNFDGTELPLGDDIFDVTLGMVDDVAINDELIKQDELQEVGLEDSTLLEAPLNISDDVDSLESEDNDIVLGEENIHKAIDYSVFNYTPVQEDNNVDADMISDRLIKLNNDKPELNILQIFDLKYKQNQSIENIAKELNIDESSVIRALDEMVDLI